MRWRSRINKWAFLNIGAQHSLSPFVSKKLTKHLVDEIGSIHMVNIDWHDKTARLFYYYFCYKFVLLLRKTPMNPIMYCKCKGSLYTLYIYYINMSVFIFINQHDWYFWIVVITFNKHIVAMFRFPKNNDLRTSHLRPVMRWDFMGFRWLSPPSWCKSVQQHAATMVYGRYIYNLFGGS